jgi:cation:H+ antiporter
VGLFVLFVSQVGLEFVFLKFWAPFPEPKLALLLAYTAIYIVAGTALFVRRRRALRRLMHYTANSLRLALGREPTEPVREG